MKRRKPKRKKRQKEVTEIKWLVVGGIAFGLVGLIFVLHPMPYISYGGTGHRGATPMITAVSANDSVIIGFMFLFIATFLFSVAYRVKKG